MVKVKITYQEELVVMLRYRKRDVNSQKRWQSLLKHSAYDLLVNWLLEQMNWSQKKRKHMQKLYKQLQSTVIHSLQFGRVCCKDQCKLRKILTPMIMILNTFAS